MNIVLVTQHYRQGGLETHLCGFLRVARDRGHRVSVITGSQERIDALRQWVGDRVLCITWPQPLTAAAALATAEQMAQFCRSQEAELLHLHPFLSLALGVVTAARLGLRYVVTVHGPSNLCPPAGQAFLLDRILAGASRVYCVCQELAEAVRQMAPDARVAHLPNAVDLARWRPARRMATGPWAVVGRLDDDKAGSIWHALEALAEALGEGFQARVFGDGGARPRLERWLTERRWGGRVRLEGHRDDLPTVLEEGFAGVAGMTRVVLEGGALGLPVALAGDDGVKGLVEAEEMDALSWRNFSGRSRPVIDAGALAGQLRLMDSQPQRFHLRPWIEAHADESRLWTEHLCDLADLPQRRVAWLDAWLASLSREVLQRERDEQALLSQRTGLQEELAAASARLAAIEASRTWWVAQAIRRLGLVLAPRGTFRERVLLSGLAGLRALRRRLASLPGESPR